MVAFKAFKETLQKSKPEYKMYILSCMWPLEAARVYVFYVNFYYEVGDLVSCLLVTAGFECLS